MVLDFHINIILIVPHIYVGKWSHHIVLTFSFKTMYKNCN